MERVGFNIEANNVIETLARIRSARPNVVFAFLPPGGTTRAFLRRFEEIGLAKDGIRLVGPQDLTGENVLIDMGEEVRGVITAGSYSSAAERPQNRDFVSAWTRAYGDKVLPDFMAVSAWDGMAAIFEVIRQSRGRISSESTMGILRNWKNPDSPRGPIAIDPATREVIQDLYIRRVEIRGGRAANIEIEKVPYRRGLSN